MRRTALLLLITACGDAPSRDEPPHAPLDAELGLAIDTGLVDADALDAGGEEDARVDAGADDAASMDAAEPPALPCGGRDCGPNALCDLEHDACVCAEGFAGTPGSGCAPVVMSSGWIGSPCASDVECDFPGGECRRAPDYPGGHCTQRCTRLCPDREGSAITFCVESPTSGAGECVARCDTMVHPMNMGCREDYRCVTRSRVGEAQTTRNVCVPEGAMSPNPPDCTDAANRAGSDDCYFELTSYGDPAAESQLRSLLEGTASAAEAEAWLDANHSASTAFITAELGARVHANYTPGHSAAQPMRGMIVHYTANQREDPTIRYFVGASPHASTHFVVGSVRNGLIVQIFSHRHRAWHAGSTYNVDRFGFDFANAGYLSPRATGGYEDYAGREYTVDLPLYGRAPIEVTGGIPGRPAKYSRQRYWQPYTYYQLLSFVAVGRAIHLVYGLDRAAIERHGDVSDSRVDPGPHLPMSALLDLVFSREDVFGVAWLDAYKVERDWISRHPAAR